MIKYNQKMTMTSAMLMSCLLTATSATAGEEPVFSGAATKIPYDKSFWGSDPTYEDKPYSAEAQLKIYGDKRAVQTPRPLVELGRDIYGNGPFGESSFAFGSLNPSDQQFLVYGDWQTVLAYNDNGASRTGLLTTRLRLDIDYKLTATERIHAFINPLQRGGDITRCEFTAAKNNDAGNEDAGSCELERDFDLNALYFEGDLGAIWSGISGEYSQKDIPVAFGFFPLLFQNGVWLEDAFYGVALTIPSLNSKVFDISNADITFFAGWNDVSTELDDADENLNIYAVTAFIEANRGYWEVGYGYTDGNGGLDDQDVHNVTVSFTKRYANFISNSVRVIYNFGQNPDNGARQTADGFLLLVENSLITANPSTVIPYLNLFAGFDRPQSLARDAGAGGVLENTGINFETDNQTDFPLLDASANDTWGFALGIEYLFGLDQQLIFEFATVQVRGDASNRIAQGDQYAFGIRYQLPLDKAWIIRADAMVGELRNVDDISGIRAELRRKF